MPLGSASDNEIKPQWTQREGSRISNNLMKYNISPIRNKAENIIQHYLCSRSTKVSPPLTGEDEGEGVHKYIATALLSPSPQPSPIQREREEMLSYYKIIKNPYCPDLDNNPAFQIYCERT